MELIDYKNYYRINDLKFHHVANGYSYTWRNTCKIERYIGMYGIGVRVITSVNDKTYSTCEYYMIAGTENGTYFDRAVAYLKFYELEHLLSMESCLNELLIKIKTSRRGNLKLLKQLVEQLDSILENEYKGE